MLLRELLEQYLDEHETGVRKSTADNYRRSVRAFTAFVGHDSTIADLTTATINAWLDSMRGNMAESTRRNHRTSVKLLINFSYEEGILENKPRKIRKVKIERKNPIAWDQQEVQRAIKTCLSGSPWESRSPDHEAVLELALEMMTSGNSFETIAIEASKRGFKKFGGGSDWCRNEINRIVRAYLDSSSVGQMKVIRNAGSRYSLFFAALIAVGWDTGLRLGDILAMKKSDLFRKETGGAKIRIVQSKTGYHVSGNISKQALSLVDSLIAEGDQQRDTIWPKVSRNVVFGNVRKILKTSGLTGSFRFVRRSAATAAENVRFGGGTILLGHRGRDITLNHYVDPSKVVTDGIELPSVLDDMEGVL